MFELVLLLMALVALLFLLLFVIVFAIFQFYYNLSEDKTVFLPTVSKNINKELRIAIEEFAGDTSKINFVELGGGVANVAAYAARNFKFKEVLAIEIDWMMINLAKLYNYVFGANINFIHKNIFDYNTNDGDVIYCYLDHGILKRLYEEGYLKNNLVISTSFIIDGAEADKIISLPNFYGKMYVYDFRNSNSKLPSNPLNKDKENIKKIKKSKK